MDYTPWGYKSRDRHIALLTFDSGRRSTVREVSTYTIGETAERSGFSASALRYYEGIGLVAPSTRTGAGYRLYDDGTLTRLAFIARAKQLGCSLEEITDLVDIWDGERCGPVQKRFHDLVTTKLADAQRQIAELAALSDQLRHAAAQLAGPAIDGPCNEDCACLALDAALAPVTVTR
jgi:MerR family transcriptional regulator, copper efflux regulator